MRDKEWESCERDEIVDLQFPFLELVSVKRERERARGVEKEKKLGICNFHSWNTEGSK